jgi:hypothetical protein
MLDWPPAHVQQVCLGASVLAFARSYLCLRVHACAYMCMPVHACACLCLSLPLFALGFPSDCCITHTVAAPGYADHAARTAACHGAEAGPGELGPKSRLACE